MHKFRHIFPLAVVTLLIGAALIPRSVEAVELPSRYPRLANYYLTPTISESDARTLARWDVVVLGLENPYTSPWLIPLLRSLNPSITLLAYVPSEELPNAYASITDAQHPHAKLYAGVDAAWWMTDAVGTRLSNWPGTTLLNVTAGATLPDGQRWSTYLANFVATDVAGSGLWDGVFYDNVWPSISWVNSGAIDLDRNGATDDAASSDAAWRVGMQELLTTTRTLVGDEFLVVGNGGGQYYPAMNGRLIEEFPSAADGGWTGAMRAYFDVAEQGRTPALVIVNGTTRSGDSSDYQQLRFTLASTLLNAGFFSFDRGAIEHDALWLYDEYRAYLGVPLGAPRNLSNTKSSFIREGVWRRDFEYGVALVNATNRDTTVNLGDGFEQLMGTQDRSVNGGDVVTRVRLAAHDGVLLLRRSFTVEQGTFVNGAAARVFNSSGRQLRNGFFTYASDVTGGAVVTRVDLTGDGDVEQLVAADGRVHVLSSSGRVIATLQPLGSSYRGALNVAVGDLTGDGVPEVVVASGRGPITRIVTYSASGQRLTDTLRPYGSHFRGGASVAVADLTGDGRAEIVTGALAGGGPHVRAFDAAGRPIASFFAYTKGFRGGVSVAAGDVDGDGVAEIVTVPGAGMSAKVKVFTSSGHLKRSFYAFPIGYRPGVSLSVADIDFDHRLDILVSAPVVF